MKKRIILLLLLSLFLLVIISNPLALAQDDTQEEELANPATTEALKDRIEKAVEEKKLNNDDGQANAKTKRGFVGQVERVSSEAITFSTIRGNQIVPIGEQTQLILANRNIKIEDISIEDSAIIMGYQEKDAFSPLKIVFSQHDLKPKPVFVLIGSLVSIDANQLTVLCRKEGREHQILVNNQTKYEDITDETITKNQLFEDMQIIAAGSTEVDETSQEQTKTASIVKALVGID